LAGCLDSQHVKITDWAGAKGFDAGKTIQGRQRHLIVNTLGQPGIVATSAAAQDAQQSVAQLTVEHLVLWVHDRSTLPPSMAVPRPKRSHGRLQ
jgi:hypothetical protein